MDLRGKKVLIFGGAGLVGQAICKELVGANVQALVICSLFEKEAQSFVDELKKDFPEVEYFSEGGDIFLRDSLKEKSRQEILSTSEYRKTFYNDVINPLTKEVLEESTIYKLLQKYKPDIVIDSINTASIIAYQNIFGVSKEALSAAKKGGEFAEEVVERLVCTQYMPQLIRHVQITLQSMNAATTNFYLKIGTCGTGGMGLNIPYTHSEDRPSQMLLSKSAVAGAHSLLLFLMARTPDGPIIKELKPAAAIAWKKVGFGPISKKGKEILLEQVDESDFVKLEGMLSKQKEKEIKYVEDDGKPKVMSAPYIDTGENGLFSMGEFETLTDEGQMEFITPEEIAKCALWEIQGLNTGHDIVAALDNSVLGPTYRAGYMRHGAVSRLRDLIEETGVQSVAFELLGPPRLSKLLYEAYLLKESFGDFDSVLKESAENIAKKIEEALLSNEEIRSRIVSIGIPILFPSGKRLLRGQKIAIPADIPGQPDIKFEINDDKINKWAHDGWVDLRTININRWQTRFTTIKTIVKDIPEDDTGSSIAKGEHYWKDESGKFPISISKLASWIFINEDQGIRMKW